MGKGKVYGQGKVYTSIKIGARNNANDKGTIQAIHDGACDLGAECKPMDMNEGITAMLNGKSINVKAMKNVGGFEYARQELWDIQTACSVVSQLTNLWDFVNGETGHISEIAGIMRDLVKFIGSEIDEMEKAAS